jgi:hypothetical protein
MLSMGLDIYYLVLFPVSNKNTVTLKVLVVLVFVSKLAGILSFLSTGQGTSRARKYLDRRSDQESCDYDYQ